LKGAQEYFLPQGPRYPSYATASSEYLNSCKQINFSIVKKYINTNRISRKSECFRCRTKFFQTWNLLQFIVL